MAPALDAHTRPIAVTGFMGAGKSTVGRLLAQRLGRPFADADATVERRAGCSVRAFWERDGEAAFRALEETVTRELLLRDDAPVIALGGGALVSDATRALVRERAFCAWLDVPFAVAWERVEGAPGARPLAGDRASFEQLGTRRAEQYTAAADAIVSGAGVRRERRRRARPAGLDAPGTRAARSRGGRRRDRRRRRSRSRAREP